jgi:DNA-binding HxlR family transcriptional regulator
MKLEKITKKSPALDKRWYDDACGTALGLELLGQRWSLLIVRELISVADVFPNCAAAYPPSAPIS